ncbi:MAG: YfhO family protein, partial [bacterium]
RVPPRALAYQRALLLDGLSFGDLTRQIKSGMVHRRMIVGDYEPLQPQPYLDLINSSNLWHGRMDLERTPEYSRLLDLMGVRETLAFGPMAAFRAAQEAQTQPKKTGDLWTVKRKSALPRTFVVYQTHVDPNPATARDRILSAKFRPLQEAVVAAGSALQPSTRPQRGSATIRHYEDDRVEIDTTCYGPCLLVLTDLFYPGWEARVEGVEIPIIKTDVAFRGVPLPAGQHRVEFRYRPLSFRAGAWLFLFGMAASIFGLWRDRPPRSA